MRKALFMDIKKTFVTAHAGCMNTKNDSLDSVYAGISAGADAIEVDVRFIDEQIPVLSHDVLKQEQIKNIVKLEEVVNVIKTFPGIALNLDIKEADGIGFINELLHKSDICDRAFFTGLEPDAIINIGREYLHVPYFVNYKPDLLEINNISHMEELACMAKDLGTIGINLHYSFATRELIEAFHGKKLKVSVWTVDNEEDIHRMIQIGVDSITSRKVDYLVKINKEVRQCFAFGGGSQ